MNLNYIYTHEILYKQIILKAAFPGSEIPNKICEYLFRDFKGWFEMCKQKCDNTKIVNIIKNSTGVSSHCGFFKWSTSIIDKHYTDYWDHDTGMLVKVHTNLISIELADNYCIKCGESEKGLQCSCIVCL